MPVAITIKPQLMIKGNKVTSLYEVLPTDIIERFINLKDNDLVDPGWVRQCARELRNERRTSDELMEEINEFQNMMIDAIQVINPGFDEIPFPEDFICTLKAYSKQYSDLAVKNTMLLARLDKALLGESHYMDKEQAVVRRLNSIKQTSGTGWPNSDE